MISVGGSSVAPLFSPGRYLGLYALCCLVFGLAFTYPVVLVFLEVIRVVPSARLRRCRRHAIVVIVAAAAVITPSNDPFSFLAMAVPLLALYEVSILVGRALKR
jgi:sec-independent protein translocase protein TatC